MKNYKNMTAEQAAQLSDDDFLDYLECLAVMRKGPSAGFAYFELADNDDGESYSTDVMSRPGTGPVRGFCFIESFIEAADEMLSEEVQHSGIKQVAGFAAHMVNRKDLKLVRTFAQASDYLEKTGAQSPEELRKHLVAVVGSSMTRILNVDDPIDFTVVAVTQSGQLATLGNVDIDQQHAMCAEIAKRAPDDCTLMPEEQHEGAVH